MARPICFRLLTHCDRRAASRAAWTAGKSRAIRTAMMAMTTRSSMSVKPRLRMRQLLAGLDARNDGKAEGRERDTSGQTVGLGILGPDSGSVCFEFSRWIRILKVSDNWPGN